MVKGAVEDQGEDAAGGGEVDKIGTHPVDRPVDAVNEVLDVMIVEIGAQAVPDGFRGDGAVGHRVGPHPGDGVEVGEDMGVDGQDLVDGVGAEEILDALVQAGNLEIEKGGGGEVVLEGGDETGQFLQQRTDGAIDQVAEGGAEIRGLDQYRVGEAGIDAEDMAEDLLEPGIEGRGLVGRVGVHPQGAGGQGHGGAEDIGLHGQAHVKAAVGSGEIDIVGDVLSEVEQAVVGDGG